jgi:SAUR family protein
VYLENFLLIINHTFALINAVTHTTTPNFLVKEKNLPNSIYINPPHSSSYPPQKLFSILTFSIMNIFQKLFRAMKPRRNNTHRRSDSTKEPLTDFPPEHSDVPEGHVPVYVGEEMVRFIVTAELLNHPVFVNLLNISAQEYGYQGVLRIPCRVVVFERVLEAIRQGRSLGAIHELLKDE